MALLKNLSQRLRKIINDERYRKEVICKIREILSYYVFPEPKNFKYDLAVTAIIKNEGRYIDEWIKYHLLVGVQHFYLYNNESEDNICEVLEPYIKNGVVDLIDFPGRLKQLPSYHDAIKNFRNECRYMAIIDADEFIRPIDHNKNILQVIDEIMQQVKNSKHVAGIYVTWLMFGSSGYVQRPISGGVLSNFLYRNPDKINELIGKVIINPRRVFMFGNPHFPLFFNKIFCIIDESGRKQNDHYVYKIPQKICINHYYTKSREEYQEKISRGKADLPDKRVMSEFYDSESKNNKFYDDSMLYFVERMRDIKTYVS